MPREDKLSMEAIKAIEDQVFTAREDKSEVWKATMYMLLYAEGMTLDKARRIRRKNGITD